jgi:hypothetical protein
MENANILTLFWASFLYTPSLKSSCQLLKRIWSYSSPSTFSSYLALFRPTSGRGFASCFLRLRVFHTAVRYGKRHVNLIETSLKPLRRREGPNDDRIYYFKSSVDDTLALIQIFYFKMALLLFEICFFLYFLQLSVCRRFWVRLDYLNLEIEVTKL